MAKKVKHKSPPKIKLNFSSKIMNTAKLALPVIGVKFLKFSTKNDHSFNISKVTPIYYVHYMLVISYALVILKLIHIKVFFTTFACFSGVATCIWCLFCSDLVTLAYISHKTEVLLFVILEIKSNTDRFLVLCKKYVNAFSTWRIRKLVGHCPFFSNFFFFLSTLYIE